MTENIVQFVKPIPHAQEEIEFADACEHCLCADACARFNLLETDESKDAWLAECERVAADKGGFRGCDTSIEMGEGPNGTWFYYRNGMRLHEVGTLPGVGA